MSMCFVHVDIPVGPTDWNTYAAGVIGKFLHCAGFGAALDAAPAFSYWLMLKSIPHRPAVRQVVVRGVVVQQVILDSRSEEAPVAGDPEVEVDEEATVDFDDGRLNSPAEFEAAIVTGSGFGIEMVERAVGDFQLFLTGGDIGLVISQTTVKNKLRFTNVEADFDPSAYDGTYGVTVEVSQNKTFLSQLNVLFAEGVRSNNISHTICLVFIFSDENARAKFVASLGHGLEGAISQQSATISIDRELSVHVRLSGGK